MSETISAQWMLGAILFASCCAVAAFAAERALRAMRLPTRGPWVLALAIGAVWPVIASIVLSALAPDPTASQTSASVLMSVIPVTSDNGFDFSAWLARLDTPLTWVWSIASGLLLIQILLALRTLQGVRRRARLEQLQGEQVLIDESVGPAVLGLVRPHIVIPSWVLTIDAPLRALVLRHEREHCKAGDPALVWLSVVTTTAMPWNPALWWISRRLRIAMEIDCDARTLRDEADTSRYAKLLLFIAQQSPSARFVPMLSHSASQLSRRIHAMNNASTRFRTLRVLTASGIAVLAGAAACSSRIATNLTSPVATPVANSESNKTATTAPAVVSESAPGPTVAKEPYFDFQVEVPANPAAGNRGPRYPDAQRAAGVSGSVLAQFVVNVDGSVDSTTIKLLRESDPAFGAAVRSALPSMKFNPALVGGKAVRQLVQTPFQFGVAPMPARPAPVRVGEVKYSASPVGAAPRPAADPAFDFQTDNHASIKPDNVAPKYPDELRATKVNGDVLVQFIVNRDGTADMSSLKVLKSDHPAFTQSVREALAEMKFEPARVKGQAVRQLMQSPFSFQVP